MRRPRGRIALAIVFALFALNAWAQVILVPLDMSDDPAILTTLQLIVGAAAALAAIGSWSMSRWAPAAALAYGLMTGAMIVSLEFILDLGVEARGGLVAGGLLMALFGFGAAWYLRRSASAERREEV